MYQGHPVIGLCMVRADDERNFILIEALSKKIHSIGARLIIYQSTTNLYWEYKPEGGEREIYKLVDYSYVDLMIVFSEIINDETLIEEIVQRAKAYNKPVFTIGKAISGCTNFSFLYVDGIEKAIRHCFEEHACREYCFVAGPEGEATSELRIKKYKEVMDEYDLPESRDRIYYGGYWSIPAMAVANELLKLDHLPEAIICANDSMAIAIADVFSERGVRVPQDVILTGLDGTIESKANVPTITTSGCDMNELADLIVSAFQKTQNGEELEEEYYTHFNLIPGQSCGCEEYMGSSHLSDYLKYNINKQNEKLFVEQSFHAIYEKILGSPDVQQLPHILNNMNFDSLSILVNEDSLRSNINPLAEGYRVGFDRRQRVLYQSGRDLAELPTTIQLSALTPDLDLLMRKERPIVLSPLCFFSRAVGYIVYAPEVTNQNYYMIMPYTNSLSEIIGSYSMVRHSEYNAQQMDRMARHDYLTDLYNRTGFYTHLPHLLKRCETPYYAAVTIDMDGLKNANDWFGHETGDVAIRFISRAVSDAADENAICGRFGGDEFVICAGVQSELEAEGIRKKIQAYLKEERKNTSLPCEVSVSIGICVVPRDEFDFDRALKVSDEKMYKEKNGKKNRRTG